VERRNRILGIRLEARQPIAAGKLREVCDGYGMDDEAENEAACDPRSFLGGILVKTAMSGNSA
jgi:hypothetical protein